MAVEALTITGQAIRNLKGVISNCATFQEPYGSAAEALKYIFVPRKRASKRQNDKPIAVISLPGQSTLGTDLIAGGAANHFRLNGELELMLIRDVVDLGNEEDELIDFLNWAEMIWDEMIAQAAVDDKLAIVGAPTAMAPSRSKDTRVAGQKVQKPFYKVVFGVKWKN